MVLACILVIIGIMFMTLTFLPNSIYSIVVFIGFTIYGIGLGLYATPSTDTAVYNVPAAKAGEAAGIYKMTSTLGGSLGLAISVAVYSVVEKIGSMEAAASTGLVVNIIFAGLALFAVVTAIPKTRVPESINERKAS